MKRAIFVCISIIFCTQNSISYAKRVPDSIKFRSDSTVVTVVLKDSDGNTLSNGSLKVYQEGEWRNVSGNGDGTFTLLTSSTTLSYEMTYEHSVEQKSNIPVSNNPVTFQTVNATVRLKNSSGQLIDEGSVQYYSGGWHSFGTTSSGIAAKELLPGSYTFRMTYEHGSNNKEQDIGTNNTVEFQTVKADIRLKNSSGSLIDAGTVQYYSGGWHELGTTSGGIAAKELLPKNYTFRMTYEHGSNNKQQDIGSDSIVNFQTTNTEVHLKNSQGNFIDQGTVQYYAGGWHDFGTTSAGVASKELLPESYTFRMTYEHGSNNKKQDVGSDNVVEFQTVKARVQLRNSQGNFIDEGTVQYYGGGWHSFGITSNGEVTKELLPQSYTFRMTYEHGSESQKQNIGTDSIIEFNTINVTVELRNSPIEGEVTYYAGGWHNFGSTTDGNVSRELISDTYTFRINYDGNSDQKKQDIGSDSLVLFNESATQPPVLTIDEPAEGVATQQDSITISGTVDNPASTTVTVDGQEVLVETNGSFSTNVALSEGANTIIISANNQSGEVTEIQRIVTRDSVVPQITVSAPSDSLITSQQQLLVEGSVSERESTVTVNGDTTAIDQNGDFSTLVSLSEGQNNITIEATDPAGNNTYKSLSVVADFNAPDLSLKLALGEPSNSGTQILDVNNHDTLTIDREQVYIIGVVEDELTDVEFALNQISVLTQAGDLTDRFEKKVGLSEGLNAFEILAVDQAGNATTKQIVIKKPVTYPFLSINDYYETDGLYFDISGTVIDTTEIISFTIDGEFQLLSQNGEFSKQVALTPGDNFFLVKAVNADSNEVTQSVKVVRNFDSTLAPDPQQTASQVDSTVVTTMQASTEFLYKGDNPVQREMEQGTIETRRASVIRGKVLDKSGSPLSGVLITILDHPEYGYTISRQNGRFDMAVNGGGNIIMKYEKENYLPVQRQVDMPWQDYATAEDVVMVQLDPNVTSIDFSDSTEVAQGSRESDADGSRQATLLFEKGTQATMVMPDGSTQRLDSIDVRATEYTIGSNGPAAMPAKLPPASGYTYAVEFSVDQALEAGAMEVQFDKHVINYVENFIGFPVGTIVPSGYYDKKRGEWVASKNGKVIEIKSISGGIAEIDIDGDGLAEPSDSLLTLGIDNAEREKLASLYLPGQSLWRVEISHFTPWDHNWPYGPPADANPPAVKQEKKNLKENNKSDNKCGSIISAQNLTLAEKVPLTGVPCGLYYNSAAVPGYKDNYTLPIALTDSSISTDMTAIKLEVNVAGNSISRSFTPQPNLNYTFEWDGEDIYGRTVFGSRKVYVRVGYTYKAAYYESSQEFDKAFGNPGEQQIQADREANTVTLWQDWVTSLGQLIRKDFGGWHPGIHHQYDFTDRTLHEGNGTIRPVESVNNTIKSIFDNEEWGDFWIEDVEIGPDGSIYTSLDANTSYQILRKHPDGQVETTIEIPSCYTPTISAMLIPDQFGCISIGQMDISSTGEIYFSDPFNNRVFKINNDNQLQHVAGTGDYGYSGDGGPAVSAELDWPLDLAVGDDGSVFIADSFNNVIRKIDNNGIISTIAGTGEYVQEGDLGDGSPATEAKFAWVRGLDIGPDGSLFIADTDQGRIRKMTPDGIINTVAGSGSYTGRDFGSEFQNDRGDGGPAEEAILLQPYDVAVGEDGSLYVAENNAHHIRKVTPDGIIYLFAGVYGAIPYRSSQGDDEGGFNYNGGAALATELSFPHAISTGPEGNVYFTEEGNSYVLPKVRMIERELDYFDSGEIIIASRDGSQLFEFTGQGKHQKTLDALTGNTIYSFKYDSTGLLSKIIDIDGLETTIERAPDGTPKAFVAPFGQRTELTMGADGYLSAVQNPAGETYDFSYADGGLLTQMNDPKNNLTTYQYDSLGHIAKADYPNGGSKQFSKQETSKGFEVTMTTAEGSTEIFTVEESIDGSKTYTTTDANELKTVRAYDSDGTITVILPNGTTTYTKQKPDPRFGMQAPITDSMAVETPSGLVSIFSQTRTVTQFTGDEVTGLTDSLITNGKVTVSEYNGNQNLTTTTSPEGRQSFSYTDSLGRVIKSVTPGIEPVDNTYNNDGFLVKTEQGGRTTEFTYNSDGYLESTTDPLGRTETTHYDSVGRVNKQILPNGEEIDYEYDSNGNLVSIAPPGQPSHTFEYTEVDLTESYSPPTVPDSAGGINYLYNLDKQLVSTTFSDSSIIQMVYDTTNGYSPRPTKIIYDQGTTSFAYDSTTGQLSSVVSSDSVSTTYSYDGSLTTRQMTSGVVNGNIDYTYNNDFQVTSQSINGTNTVGFTYDGDGLLVGAGALSLTYDAQNGLLRADTLGQVTSSYSHNGFGELTGKTAAYNGSDLYNRSFTRDSLGRITHLTETIGGQTDTYDYTYNTIGYLVQVDKNGSMQAKYEYDANGNRTATITPADTVTATYDAQDRMLTYGVASYDYGPRGDLQRKIVGADTTIYDYDNRGNLRTVTLPDGTSIEYLTDGQDRRVAKKVNGAITKRWLYVSGLMPIAELDSTGSVEKRYGPGYIVKNDTTYRIVRDHLGSVRLAVNSQTGEIKQRMDYDAYGNVLTDTNPGFQPFGYAGGLYDSQTELVRFGARDYDPEVGRWTSKDPILFQGGTSNIYEYVLNDPINKIDINGLQPCDQESGISALLTSLGYSTSALSTFTGRLLDKASLRDIKLFSKNYSLRETLSLTRFGPTVKSSMVLKAARGLTGLGIVAGGTSIAKTFNDIINGKISKTEGIVDATFGAVSMMGWPGAVISSGYFGPKYYYEYTTGKKMYPDIIFLDKGR